MTCIICGKDTPNIEPQSSENFPICVSCVDAQVEEIAEIKAAVDHYNENLVEGEALMTCEEMKAILN